MFGPHGEQWERDLEMQNQYYRDAVGDLFDARVEAAIEEFVRIQHVGSIVDPELVQYYGGAPFVIKWCQQHVHKEKYPDVPWNPDVPYFLDEKKYPLSPPRLSELDIRAVDFERIAYMKFPLGLSADQDKTPLLFPVEESPAILFVGPRNQQTHFIESIAQTADWADKWPGKKARLQRTTIITPDPQKFSRIREMSTVGFADMEEGIVLLYEQIITEKNMATRPHRLILIDSLGSFSDQTRNLVSLMLRERDICTHVIATVSTLDFLKNDAYEAFPRVFVGSHALIKPGKIRFPSDPIWQKACNLPPWQFLEGNSAYWMVKP